MNERLRHGYLLIADISGYTAFLTGNELEHAQGIIEDLTRCILDELGPPLRLVKLEGDAVFCWAPLEAFASAERVIEAIEHCYCRFVDHRDDMIRATTCTCQACASIATLDLKFVAHAGEFVLQQLGGREDLAGPDVILVHRLLKNTIAEATGKAGYAFLTQSLLDLVGRPLELPSHQEAYESLGTVRGGVLDLAPVVEAIRSSRRVIVEADEADFRATLHVPAPAAVAWDWWVNPARSLQWIPGVTGWEDHPRDDGRLGAGSTMHCAHGSGLSFQRYLDWRPFEYLTAETSVVRGSLGTPPPGVTSTIFRELPGGTTEIEFRARAHVGRVRRLLMLPLIKLTIGREFRKAERKLAHLIAAEQAAAQSEPAPER